MKINHQLCYLTFMGSCFLSSTSMASTQYSNDLEQSSLKNQKSVYQNSLIEQISEFQHKINTCSYDNSLSELTQLHSKFRTFKHDMSQWEKVGRSLNLYPWPEQNWYQTVAGHLFFPQDIYPMIESSLDQSFTVTNKVMWRLAISAFYQHPLAQYYLVRTLGELKEHYNTEKLTSFFLELYQSAISNLSQCTDYNDACYALGMSKTKSFYDHNYNFSDALKSFNQGTDFKNKFKKIAYIPIVCRQEEYLRLAQQGYGRAYRELALNYTQKFDKRKYFFEKAIEHGDLMAMIDLAELYENNNDLISAKKSFLEAGSHKISEGHIQYANCLIGENNSNFDKFKARLQILPPQILEEAIKHLTIAGQAHNARGWEYLADIKKCLYDMDKTEEKAREMFETLVEGIRLGSPESHSKMMEYFKFEEIKDRLHQLYESYGYPPQTNLDAQIQNYWESLKK
ncbi:MAG: hypothetical protein ACRYGR_06135 [Janthinobacterium lividum]